MHTAARVVEGREHHPHQALHYVMPSCHHLGCPLDVATHWPETVLSRLCSSTNALAARLMPTEVHGTQTQRQQRYGRCIVTMNHVRDVESQLTKKEICTAAVRCAADQIIFALLQSTVDSLALTLSPMLLQPHIDTASPSKRWQ